MPVQPKGSWLGEGDDFTFMNMPENGLRAYEEGSYGGRDGRDAGSKEAMNFSLPSNDTSAKAMATALGNLNNQQNKTATNLAYPDFFPAA